jgi:hypothetical protein
MCAILPRRRWRALSELRKRPIAILDGDPPLETVFALNQSARTLGLESGMYRLQAESFGGVTVSARAKEQEDSAFLALMKSAVASARRNSWTVTVGTRFRMAQFLSDTGATAPTAANGTSVDYYTSHSRYRRSATAIKRGHRHGPKTGSRKRISICDYLYLPVIKFSTA